MMNEQARVRLDNAPGLTSLAKDPCLSRLGIRLEYGDTRNVNKNPVCEKAIRELEQEIVRLHPEGGLLSDSDIQVVLKVLNNRIRNRGFTAQEIMFQRELSTGNPLSMNDENLAKTQFEYRSANHEVSARTKVPFGITRTEFYPKPGTLVFIKDAGDKHSARDRYMVMKTDEHHAYVRKLTDKFQSKLIPVKSHQIFSVPGFDFDNQDL
jgi:hypothetical protein